ncbi:MAG: 2-C-methyl-D-erythritol 4-phosphate cytidylyltransferase [Deltaproteobacteria bacterium]
MKTTAIVLSAGAGKRMETTKAKQYLLLGDMLIVAHSLCVFQKTKVIDEIILVTAKDDIETATIEIVHHYNISKCNRIIAGGKERQDSVKNALAIISDDTDVILIHDGVRPFVSEKMINDCVKVAQEFGGSVVGVPLKDTLKHTDESGFVKETPERSAFWIAQTPQAFRKDIISIAYETAYLNGYYGTDDASLVERIGKKVKMVLGAYDNIKITTPEDMLCAEMILKDKR